jgi:hypothetical protein
MPPLPVAHPDCTRAFGAWEGPPTLQIAPGKTGRLRFAAAGAGDAPRKRLRMTETKRHGEATSRFLGRVCNLLLPLLLLASAAPAQLPATFTKVGPEYRLTLGADPSLYFGVQHTEDLLLPFGYVAMSLGEPGPIIFGYTPAPSELRGFFRARGISVSAPEDQDNDFLDDIWELQHPMFNGLPYLDPLNPNDAFLPSPEPDAGGRNNLDYYRFKRGITPLKEAVTREVTVFNFGAPLVAAEALSRTVSVFNGASIPTFPPEVYSREVSAFNFGSPLTASEAIAREVTVFNFGSPPAQVEAISRALSVFNGQTIPDGTAEVYSREVTAFNYGAPVATVEAISRAVSVLNTAP